MRESRIFGSYFCIKNLTEWVNFLFQAWSKNPEKPESPRIGSGFGITANLKFQNIRKKFWFLRFSDHRDFFGIFEMFQEFLKTPRDLFFLSLGILCPGLSSLGFFFSGIELFCRIPFFTRNFNPRDMEYFNFGILFPVFTLKPRDLVFLNYGMSRGFFIPCFGIFREIGYRDKKPTLLKPISWSLADAS